ncbi:MAG: DUF4366 domain-containing protein [Clostridiales bacterium]|jgi:hypothetical protein|nr:DUF4366 domain-containing protein [Clostridiales bacterium]
MELRDNVAAAIFAAVFLLFAAFGAATARADDELAVESFWLDGDTLHVQVTDAQTGVDQALELDMREYAGSADEFITVQAVDRSGAKSNTIQFRNPYYDAQAVVTAEPSPTKPASSSARPFTPDGTGTVMDDAHDGDDKEFFSVKAGDGNVFYIIVDRQRTSDNVYLLNEVTEDDLVSLAKPGVDTVQSAPPSPTPNMPPSSEPTQEAVSEPKNGGADVGSIIFIAVAAIAVGGAAYYFKILKPRKQAKEEEYDDPDFDDEEYGADGGGAE